MKSKYILLLGIFLLCFNNGFAHKITHDIATHAGGYDIPIVIATPDNIKAKLPVVFYVHGGGWNGGTSLEVPKAGLPADVNFFCDRLGVIYVGLAYRCKGNNGTFALAIEDLKSSIKWFMDRAEAYNADLTRIGFSGSSAGTTLAAIMAQYYPSCKLYIGSEGMYNIVDIDNDLSHFPSEEARGEFGLISDKEKLDASPYYNLRKNPATALLLHGTDDWLCNYTQSQRYAEKIKASGGDAKAVIYEGINHTCMDLSYPEVIKNSLMEIAEILIKEFMLKGIDLNKIEAYIDEEIKGFYPSENITKNQLLGTWKGNNDNFIFQKDGDGYFINSKMKYKKKLTYKVNKSSFEVQVEGESIKRQFYLRKNNKTVYELILENNRWKSRRNNYQK